MVGSVNSEAYIINLLRSQLIQYHDKLECLPIYDICGHVWQPSYKYVSLDVIGCWIHEKPYKVWLLFFIFLYSA